MIHLHANRAVSSLAAALLLLAPPGSALAHHSFAVFFSSDKDVTSVKGVVKAYRFTNPHGVIDLVVPTANGGEANWRVETNSPSILTRRGWTKDSVAVGEVITVQGWAARDGSNYLRMRSAFRATGVQIGGPGAAEGVRP